MPRNGCHCDSLSRPTRLKHARRADLTKDKRVTLRHMIEPAAKRVKSDEDVG